MLATLEAAVGRFSGTDLTDFLGLYGPAAARMLSERQTDTERLVSARIVSASAQFAERFSGPLESNLAQALHQTYRFDPYFTSHPCPACQTDAAIGGTIEMRDHVDYDPDGTVSVHVEPILWSDRFRCLACGLDLVGSDEIAAAGIDVDASDGIPLQGHDAEDAIQAYQEDLYMDLHDEDRHGL